MHAAMMPADIKHFFVPVFKQAQALKEAYDKEKRKKIKMPFVTVCVLYNDNVYMYHQEFIKSKSMQPSIPPIGLCWTFSTSQVDLTHNDDYVVTIVNIINFTNIVFTSMQ